MKLTDKIPYYTALRSETLSDFRIKLWFADGKSGVVDFKPLLSKKLYAPLNDPSLFAKYHIFCGGLVWNDDIDICPEWLYDNAHEEI